MRGRLTPDAGTSDTSVRAGIMGFLNRVLVMNDGLNLERGSIKAALRRPATARSCEG